jgi:ATP-dependent protease ClpP protease subunit
MRRYLVVAALFTLLYSTTSAGALVIQSDNGGRIGDYVEKYNTLRDSGEMVVINGFCASACTLILGKISPERMCATPRAKLAFHQAWDIGQARSGAPVMAANNAASEYLYSMYPRRVRDWIFVHGGLPSPNRLLILSGRQLQKFVASCSND